MLQSDDLIDMYLQDASILWEDSVIFMVAMDLAWHEVSSIRESYSRQPRFPLLAKLT